MGRYVIYQVESSAIVKGFATAPAAKGWLTRMLREGKIEGAREDYGITDVDHYYAKIEKMVTRVNLMSGEEYQESINTPLSCSPASETYWSM